MICLSHIVCPAVPFNTAQALERFLSNISITVCFPICRALLRLVERCLPCRESAKLRSSAFPNQTDNLCLRCFSRKSKNYSFSSQTGAFIVTSWIHTLLVHAQNSICCALTDIQEAVIKLIPMDSRRKRDLRFKNQVFELILNVFQMYRIS